MDPKEKELEQREKALEEREKKLEKREKELGFFSQAVKEKKESWYDQRKNDGQGDLGRIRPAGDCLYPDHPGSHGDLQAVKAGCVSGTYPGTQFFVPSHLFHRICSIAFAPSKRRKPLAFLARKMHNHGRNEGGERYEFKFEPVDVIWHCGRISDLPGL